MFDVNFLKNKKLLNQHIYFNKANTVCKNLCYTTLTMEHPV